MFDKKLFQRDPRNYAYSLWEDGMVDADTLITACLKYMSHDDVRDMLDANELSPRFDPDEEEETEEDSEEETA